MFSLFCMCFVQQKMVSSLLCKTTTACFTQNDAVLREVEHRNWRTIRRIFHSRINGCLVSAKRPFCEGAPLAIANRASEAGLMTTAARAMTSLWSALNARYSVDNESGREAATWGYCWRGI